MNKIITCIAIAFFTITLNAQEAKSKTKEYSAKTMSADEIAKCQAKCKAEGKVCSAKEAAKCDSKAKKCCAKKA